MEGDNRVEGLLKLGSSEVNSTACAYGCVRTCLDGFLCQHKVTYPRMEGWNLGSCYNKKDQVDEEGFQPADEKCEKYKLDDESYEICCIAIREECGRCDKVCKVEGPDACQDNFISPQDPDPDPTTEENNDMISLFHLNKF